MDKSKPGTTERVAHAIAEVETTLERTAKYYPADLPADHYARRTNWHFEPRRAAGGAVRHGPEEFARFDPLRRQIELTRSQAEALLVAERLGEVILGAQQREDLTRRALGIVPSAEADRLREVFACAELQPRHFAGSATATLAALEQIERELGQATALTYCMLSLAGQRQEEEIVRYGQRLDKVFDRLVSAPAVIQALDFSVAGDVASQFDVLYALLQAVREQLWTMKPNRLSSEFLLTQVIDNYLGARSTAGNSLGLALFDSIILGKLGFRANYLIEDSMVQLQVPVAGRNVFWEVTEHVPLSFLPISGGRVVDLRSLFAIAYGSLATMCFTRSMWDRSVEAYQRTLELNPTSVETRTSLALCQLRRQSPDDAVRELRACLEIEPNAPDVHHQLGNAYAMQSNWPKAIDSFKRALRISPGMAEVYNNLGFAYLHTGNNQQGSNQPHGADRLAEQNDTQHHGEQKPQSDEWVGLADVDLGKDAEP